MTGTARVDIYQLSPTGNVDDSADATLSNALAAPYIGSALYSGDFWFMTSNSNDSTTINEWLTSAGGSYTELGGGFDETLTISRPNIGGANPTALTTWFVFSAVGSAFDFQVDHDDGLQIIDDFATTIYSSPQPQTANGFSPVSWDGGFIQLAYAATNGDPSVLKLKGTGTLTAVPLPAALPLLAGGLGILGFAGWRRKKAA
ncbi:MAG: hypothetical protein Tsb0019_40410 [Roseibium sp.]